MFTLKELELEEAKKKKLHFSYISHGFYHLIKDTEFAFHFTYINEATPKPKQFDSFLVDEVIEKPIAFVALVDDQEAGYVSLGIDTWNQRLRVWNLLVLEPYRRQGIGTMLMNKAKEMLKLYQLRMIVLETQSCNNLAIDFYHKQGFNIIGFDTTAYTNYDIENHEVRLELGFDFQKETLDNTKEILIEHIKCYPKMEEEDLVKLLYQSVFGPGHMIPSKEASLTYLRSEIATMSQLSTRVSSVETIGSNMIRFHLPSKIDEETLLKLNDAFYLSSLYQKKDTGMFLKKIEACIDLVEKEKLPYDILKIKAIYEDIKAHQFQPIHHSNRYQQTYQPHYRVMIKSVYQMCLLQKEDLHLFSLPFSVNDVIVLKPINKGWSYDQKYYLELSNQRYILRLSDRSTFLQKQAENAITKQIFQTGIPMSKPIAFGVSKNQTIVYSLLEWIEGEEALDVISNYSEEEQYEFGLKAGRMLKMIHSLPIPTSSVSETTYTEKLKKKFTALEASTIKPLHDMSGYLRENYALLQETQRVLHHGDYHLGNMVIDSQNTLHIIDFNRFDYGDPAKEFDRLIMFTRNASISFAIGQIDGYFDQNEVPELFWRQLAFYAASNITFGILWAAKYSSLEIEREHEGSEMIFQDYNGFQSIIPRWYQRRKHQ